MVETVNQRKLYEQDFVAWCDDTVAKLKASLFSDIHIDSLVEEIEGLAGRDQREERELLRGFALPSTETTVCSIPQ